MRTCELFCGALLLVVFTSCTRSESSPQAKAEPAPAPAPKRVEPPASPSPGVQDDGSIVSAVAWFHGSLEQAKAEAKREGKTVMVVAGAYWCPPCHRLDEEVFVRPDVAKAIEARAVPVHLDVEQGEGPEFAKQYKVLAYPTIVVLDADGLEKGRIVDFVAPEELLTALERIDKQQNVLGDLEQAVQDKPGDAQTRYELAHAYALAAKRDEAKRELEAVMVADPRDELGLASQALYDEALFVTYKIDGEPQRAIAQFEQLQQRFPDSEAALKAYRHIGRIHMHQGDEAAALRSLEAMLAFDPHSQTLVSRYGWFCFRQHCKSDRALEVVEAALERDDDAGLRYLAAELAAQQDQLGKAKAHIAQAVALAPKSAFYRRQQRRFANL